MGTDDLGNKYYERPEAQYGVSVVLMHCPDDVSALLSVLEEAESSCICTGRHRWVVYANLDWPDGYEPTQVPAEWHGMPSLLSV